MGPRSFGMATRCCMALSVGSHRRFPAHGLPEPHRCSRFCGNPAGSAGHALAGGSPGIRRRQRAAPGTRGTLRPRLHACARRNSRPPSLRARNRNTPLLIVLAGIWLTDVVFLYALMRDDPLLARTSLLVAIDIVLLLVTVIGGRVVPTFTANALRARDGRADICSNRCAHSIAIVAMIAVAVADIVTPSYRLVGGIAAIAALVYVWRLSGWPRYRLDEPLVWSLHLAYAWLPVGLAMKALDSAGSVAWAAHWLDALTIGVAAAHDPCRHDPCLARTYRPPVTRVAADRWRVHSAIARGGDGGVRTSAGSRRRSADRHCCCTVGDLRFGIFIVVYTPNSCVAASTACRDRRSAGALPPRLPRSHRLCEYAHGYR